MSKRLLIVGGVARSGTTALNRVLNAHPLVMIGKERYIYLFNRAELDRSFFEKERFLDVRKSDTHKPDQFENREEASARFDRAEIIGDKYPRVFSAYDLFRDRLPEVEFLYILRNPFSVAESYQQRFENPEDRWKRDFRQGIGDWNRSVRATIGKLEQGWPITVVTYERVFESRETVSTLFAALGLSPAEADTEIVDGVIRKNTEVNAAVGPRNETIRREVSLGATFGLYRKLVNGYCLFSRKQDP